MKNLMTILGLFGVIILLIAGCSSAPEPEEVSNKVGDVYTQEASLAETEEGTYINYAFASPAGMTFMSVAKLISLDPVDGLREVLSFAKQDTPVYTWTPGTYEWNDSTYAWDYVSDTPNDGIVLKWAFQVMDTTGTVTNHTAELVLSDIGVEIDAEDTVLTSIKVDFNVDGEAIFTFSFNYEEDGNNVSVDYMLTVYNLVEVSLAFSGVIDENDEIVSGTFSGHYTDFLNGNYRLDYEITLNEDNTSNWNVTDSDGWELDIDADAPETLTTDYGEIEKVDITGEILKDGKHGADIEGTLYNPEVPGQYESEVWFIYPDGTKESLDDIVGEEEGGTKGW